MMNDLLVLFIVLNIVNVVLNTVKSILTVKGGALSAAIINAVTFFVYTYVLIYTNSDLPMLVKASVVAVCNFVGVFVVKVIENKLRKDKLWKIEVTIPKSEFGKMLMDCKSLDLSFNYIDIDKYVLFNFYCPTQKDSAEVKTLLKDYHAKYFVNETKIL